MGRWPGREIDKGVEATSHDAGTSCKVHTGAHRGIRQGSVKGQNRNLVLPCGIENQPIGKAKQAFAVQGSMGLGILDPNPIR